MITIFESIILILDVLILGYIFYKVLKNVQPMRMTGMFRVVVIILGVWLVSKLVGFQMIEVVFGTMVAYTFLAVMVLFPDEFRKVIDGYGRKRLFKWDKDKLLDAKSRKELTSAIMDMSRDRVGALIVIARGSSLQDEIDSGINLGEVVVRGDIIKNLLQSGSPFSNGAIIIRDNTIVSANSLLPIARRDDLIQAGAGTRHLAALGITYKKDCLAIVVSESTGKITLASKVGDKLEYMFAIETKEMNIIKGIDEFELSEHIDNLLESKETKEEEIARKRKREENKNKTREEREQEIQERKEKKRKENEKKRKELQKRKEEKRKNRGKNKGKNKEEESDEPVSRGFGGYDMEDLDDLL